MELVDEAPRFKGVEGDSRNGDVVHPDLREIVHRMETKQATSIRIGLPRRVELVPIPRHAVVSRQGLLQDARHAKERAEGNLAG